MTATTDVPASITTPETVKTMIGTLEVTRTARWVLAKPLTDTQERGDGGA
jgi:hypothetical protein